MFDLNVQLFGTCMFLWDLNSIIDFFFELNVCLVLI